MTNRVDQIGNGLPVQQVENRRPAATPNQGSGPSFAEILNQTISGGSELKVSHHAQERMDRRNIQLTGDDLSRVEKAVQTAKEKGSKDSLVLLDNVAFLVSVKNNTIVTAVDRENQSQQVFTKIDSVILA
jgi:flagellar operon protein